MERDRALAAGNARQGHEAADPRLRGALMQFGERQAGDEAHHRLPGAEGNARQRRLHLRRPHGEDHEVGGRRLGIAAGTPHPREAGCKGQRERLGPRRQERGGLAAQGLETFHHGGGDGPGADESDLHFRPPTTIGAVVSAAPGCHYPQ